MKIKNEDYMLIRDFSKKLGITPRAIRLYEEMGLVDAPQRSDGGIRYYCEDDIDRFKVVLALKVLGISLEEMQKLAKIQHLVESEDEKSEVVLSEIVDITNIYLNKVRQKVKCLESVQADIENFRNNVLVNCVSAKGSCD